MNKLLIFCASLVAIPATSVHSDEYNWQKLGKSKDGDQYIDRNVVLNGHTARAWMLLNNIKGQDYKSLALLHSIDCNAKLVGMKMMVAYSGALASGEIVGSATNPDPKPTTEIIPGSIYDEMADIACLPNK